MSPTRTPAAKSDLGIDPRDLDGLQLQYWHAWTGETAQVIDELVNDFNSSNPWGIVVGASSLGNFDDLSGQTWLPSSRVHRPTFSAPTDTRRRGGGRRARPRVVTVQTWTPISRTRSTVWTAKNRQISTRNSGSRTWSMALAWVSLPCGPEGFCSTTRAGLRSWGSIPTTTPEEFKEQACAAAKVKQSDDDPDNDLTGGWIISTDYPAVLGWLYAFGSPVVKPGGDGYQLDSSQVEATFRFLRQLYEQRCAWLGEDISVEDEFAGRGGLFAAGSLGDIPYQQAAFGGPAVATAGRSSLSLPRPASPP